MCRGIFVVIDIRLDINAIHATNLPSILLVKRKLHIGFPELDLFKATRCIPVQTQIYRRLRIELSMLCR
jgi:hypothetical protein